MRRISVWLALAATSIAVYFAPDAKDAVVVAPAKIRANQVPVTTSGNITQHLVRAGKTDLDLQIRPRNEDQDLGNIFAGQSWAPPPPPLKIVEKPKEVSPPPPEAPPLPFQFLGRMIDDGKTAYFLQFRDRNLVMHIGDSIDKTYSLDGVNNGVLTFTYLPLNQKQTLVVGEAN